MVTEEEKKFAESEYYRTHIEGKNPWTKYSWWAYRNPLKAVGLKSVAGVLSRVAYKKIRRRAKKSSYSSRLKKNRLQQLSKRYLKRRKRSTRKG